MNEQGAPAQAPAETIAEAPVHVPAESDTEKRGRLPLLLLPLLVIALLMAVFIGTNVLGVLFGVVAPPLPPLPAGMTQIDHTSPAYGVDTWKYLSSADSSGVPTIDACSAVQYIQSNDGVCQLAPLQCGEYRETDDSFSADNSVVARCSGQVAFSIFNMQWWALVMRTPDAQTQLELHREVYWIGTGPQ